MKLVTYNIQYGVGKDWKSDLGRIAQAVDGADVIALQEVVRQALSAETNSAAWQPFPAAISIHLHGFHEQPLSD